MTFGQIIKDLRRKANMTQEQLAEILSISGQAVSRWENDIAMPDISIVPTLANLFDVSCDYLLGVDISRTEKKISEIIKKVQKYGSLAHIDYKDAVDILREGLREYPRSHRLMCNLITYLELYASQCEGKNRTALLKELISYGEKVMDECTVETLRTSAIHHLCQAYMQLGETDKAKKLVNKLPDIWAGSNRQTRLAEISQGTEQFDAKRDAIAYHLSQAIIGFNTLNTRLDNGEWALSTEEQIETYENVLTLLTMLFPDEDYGTHILSKAQACKSLSFLYFENDDMEKGISYFRKAVDAIIHFETDYRENKSHTSLLQRGKEYGIIHYMGTGTPSVPAGYLKFLMEQPFYDKIKDNQEIQDLVNTLREHA